MGREEVYFVHEESNTSEWGKMVKSRWMRFLRLFHSTESYFNSKSDLEKNKQNKTKTGKEVQNSLFAFFSDILWIWKINFKILQYLIVTGFKMQIINLLKWQHWPCMNSYTFKVSIVILIFKGWSNKTLEGKMPWLQSPKYLAESPVVKARPPNDTGFLSSVTTSLFSTFECQK